MLGRQKSFARAAFSLLELSVVLAITSVVASGGLVVGSSMVERAAYVNSEELLTQAQQTLKDFYKTNGYLPCPAAMDALPSDPAFGQELAEPTAETCTGGSGETRVGMLPVRTLGLSPSAAADKFGARILYAMTASRRTPANNLNDAFDDTILVKDANGSVISEAAYFLASHGKDRKGAIGFKDASQISPCGSTSAGTTNGSSSLDVENCNGDASFRDAQFNNGSQRQRFFDDLVRWAPIFQLNAGEAVQNLWKSTADTNHIYAAGLNDTPATTNVGIGTVDPQTALDIARDGDLTVRMTTNQTSSQASSSASLQLYGKSSATPPTVEGWALKRDTSGSFILNRDNAPNTEEFRALTITPSHFVGWGTDIPQSRFDLVFDNIAAGTSGFENNPLIRSYNSVGDGAPLLFEHARGNANTPADLATDDALGGFLDLVRINGGFAPSSGVLTQYKGNGADNASQMAFATSGATHMLLDAQGALNLGWARAETAPSPTPATDTDTSLATPTVQIKKYVADGADCTNTPLTTLAAGANGTLMECVEDTHYRASGTPGQHTWMTVGKETVKTNSTATATERTIVLPGGTIMKTGTIINNSAGVIHYTFETPFPNEIYSLTANPWVDPTGSGGNVNGAVHAPAVSFTTTGMSFTAMDNDTRKGVVFTAIGR